MKADTVYNMREDSQVVEIDYMMRTLLLAILSLICLAHIPSISASPVASVDDKIFNIAVSPDGKLLALVGSRGMRVYSLSNGETVYTLRDELKNSGQGTYAYIAWSPDGTNLAIGKPDVGVRIWNVTSWKIVADKSPNKSGIDHPGFAWSPNGSQLAVGMGSETSEILIWDKKTNDWTKMNAYTGRQVSLVWAFDGQLLVMAEQGLYDAKSGKFVRNLSTPIDGATGYAIWSPDTKLVYVFFDLGGSLTNSLTNKPVGFGACCYAEVAWSMDGKYFAATSYHDNEIWVWDTEANKVVVQERQGDIIYAFAWLPNHELLAVGSVNGHDVLWNTVTQKVLFSIDPDS